MLDWTDHQSDSVGHFIHFYIRLIPISNKIELGLIYLSIIWLPGNRRCGGSSNARNRGICKWQMGYLGDARKRSLRNQACLTVNILCSNIRTPDSNSMCEIRRFLHKNKPRLWMKLGGYFFHWGMHRRIFPLLLEAYFCGNVCFLQETR